jgi:hypothetical protein
VLVRRCIRMRWHSNAHVTCSARYSSTDASDEYDHRSLACRQIGRGSGQEWCCMPGSVNVFCVVHPHIMLHVACLCLQLLLGP